VLCSAQNLVNNSSFEAYTSCPSAVGMGTNASGWFNPVGHTGSVDYLNACAAFGVDVPNNYFGNQYAKSGNGYISMIVYSQNDANGREYIGTQLSSPLQAGQSYCVTVNVSLTDQSGFSIDRFGAYFSNGPLPGTGKTLISVTPQIEFNQRLDNTSDWTTLTLSFTAAGGEQYMYLGNFASDANITPLPNPTGANTSSLVYVDDVSVVAGSQGNLDLGNDTTLCSGSILLDATGSGSSYLWQDGSTGPTFTVTGPGTYWVAVTNSCGILTDTLVVSSTDNSNFLGEDTAMCQGPFILDLSGNNATYYLQGVSGTDSIHTITQSQWVWGYMQDQCGNIYSDTIYVSIDPLLEVDLGTNKALCVNPNITLDAGHTNKNYIWSNGSTTQTINVTTPGTYWVNVSTSDGCFGTDSVIIYPDTPINATVSSTPNSVCDGKVDTCSYSGPSILINEISISPNSGDGSLFEGPLHSYTAAKEGEWIELYNPNRCESVDISGYILGSYNVDGPSDGMGYSIPKGTVIPPNGFLVLRGRNTQPPPPGTIDLVVEDLNGSICIERGDYGKFWFKNSGSWFAFYDTNGNPQDAIKWGTPDVPSLNGRPCIPDNNFLAPTVTSLPSFNEITGASSLGPTTVGYTFVRIPDGGPWSSTQATDSTSLGSCNQIGNCQANPLESTCNGTASVIASGGTAPYYYSWNDPRKQYGATASGLCPGTYEVTVHDAVGCSETFEVTIEEELFQIDSIIVEPTICNGSDGSISIIYSDSNDINFSWSPTVSDTSFANNLGNGNYTISLSKGNCSMDTTLSINSNDSLLIEFTADTLSGCAPLNVQFTNLSSTDSSLVWYFGDGDSSITTNPTHTYLQSGIFDISLKINPTTGCSGTHVKTGYIEVFDSPIADPIPDTSFCGIGVQLTAPNSSYSNLWLPDSILSNVFFTSDSGTFFLQFTNSNGCSGIDTIHVEQYSKPKINLGPDTNLCMGSAFILSADSTYQGNYIWNTGDTTHTIVVNSSGEYTLIAESGYSCSDSDSVYITFHEIPLVELGNDTVFCKANSFVLDAGNPNATYQWSTGENQQIINIDSTGIYSLRVISPFNCIDSDSIAITIIDYPDSLQLSYDSIACLGEIATITTYTDADQVLWNNGSGAFSISLSESSSFSITASNIFNQTECSIVDSGYIKFYPLPEVNLGNDTTFCAGETFELNTEKPNYKHTWNTGDSTSQININSSGNYYVTVFNDQNCQASDSINVTIIEYPKVFQIDYDSIACEDEIILINTSTNADEIIWNDSYYGPSYESINSETISITFKNQHENVICSIDTAIQTNFYDYPILIPIDTLTMCFEHNSTQTISSPTEGDLYSWDGRYITDNFREIYSPGTYNVFIANHRECSVSQEIIVKEICPLRLYIPNAFTPNDDGINDTFIPKVSNLIELKYFIFNRWGEQIYHGQGIDDEWDGTINGTPVQIDVYVWKISAKGYNSLNNIETIEEVGTVTLLR
jgi:gliding motility-associated-like protein